MAEIVPPQRRKCSPLSSFQQQTLVTSHELAWHARNNIVALVQGMAPNYYLFGVPDGSVTALAVTLTNGIVTCSTRSTMSCRGVS